MVGAAVLMASLRQRLSFFRLSYSVARSRLQPSLLSLYHYYRHLYHKQERSRSNLYFTFYCCLSSAVEPRRHWTLGVKSPSWETRTQYAHDCRPSGRRSFLDVLSTQFRQAFLWLVCVVSGLCGSTQRRTGDNVVLSGIFVEASPSCREGNGRWTRVHGRKSGFAFVGTRFCWVN